MNYPLPLEGIVAFAGSRYGSPFGVPSAVGAVLAAGGSVRVGCARGVDQCVRTLVPNPHDVVLVDRWFPSSKTCSRCGAINKDLTLSDRIYRCDCGNAMDRDLNAAINIEANGRHTLRGDLKRTQEQCKTTT